MTAPIKIAIMGCVVNGPGEAREADIGIAGGDGVGILFRKGRVVKKFPEERLVEVLLEEVASFEKRLSLTLNARRVKKRKQCNMRTEVSLTSTKRTGWVT